MIRKILLAALILLSGNNSKACMCSGTVSYFYQNADFVGIVKILKNYKNTPDTSEYYKADIEIVKLYKGKAIKSLTIMGTNGGTRWNSCGTFIAEGKTRLIFGNRNADGSIGTYLCASYQNPLEPYFTRNKINETLDLLKKYASHYSHRIYNDAFYYPAGFKFIVDKAKANHVAIVMVTLSTQYELKKVKTLTSETKSLADSLAQYFSKINWKEKLKRNQVDTSKRKEIRLIYEINPYRSK